jgi:hypothetical protein
MLGAEMHAMAANVGFQNREQSTNHARARQLLVLALLIATFGSAVLVDAVWLRDPLASGGQNGAIDSGIVRRFYDAVNLVMASGDTAPLVSLVAPGATFLSPADGAQVGLDRLSADLSSLHRAGAKLQLSVAGVTGAKTSTLVEIVPVGDTGSLAATVTDRISEGWFDRITLRGGRIVELSGGTAGLAASQLLLQGTTSYSSSSVSIRLVDMTLNPLDLVPIVTPGSFSLSVLSGSLSVEADGELSPRWGDPDHAPVAPPVAHPSHWSFLGGDGFTTRPGASFRISAGPDHPVHLAILVLLRQESLAHASLPISDAMTVTDLMSTAAAATVSLTQVGLVGTMHTVRLETWQPGAMMFTLEEIVLPRNARVVPDHRVVSDLEILVVDGDGSALLETDSNRAAADTVTILQANEDMAVLHAGWMHIQQVGKVPVVLWLLHVERIDAASPVGHGSNY